MSETVIKPHGMKPGARFSSGVDQALDYLGDDKTTWAGKTLRELFEACEADGARVFWGLWDDATLEARIA